MKLSVLFEQILNEVELKSKTDKGNRYFQMLKTKTYKHYDGGDMVEFSGGDDKRKDLVSKLSNADKKIYRAWIKTPEGAKSLELWADTTSPLSENILAERLTDVDDDVNMIYDRYFRKDIEQIEKTGKVMSGMFKQASTNTSILTSDEAKKANNLNPCTLLINQLSNHYNPKKNIISVGYSRPAFDYIMNYGNGDIKLASLELRNPKQKQSLLQEFTEERVKGSIHHELVHWIDDTINNKHINKRVDKALERGTSDLNGVPVDSTKMEIQAQIHNVKQLYNKYKSEWDSFTFDNMLALSPSLLVINDRLPSNVKPQWRRNLIARMNREGLLGKNMR